MVGARCNIALLFYPCDRDSSGNRHKKSPNESPSTTKRRRAFFVAIATDSPAIALINFQLSIIICQLKLSFTHRKTPTNFAPRTDEKS